METLRFVLTSTFYPPWHIGGDAVLVRNLAHLLSERGHEVHVIFSKGAYALKRGTPEGHRDSYMDGDVHLHDVGGKLDAASAYLFGGGASAKRMATLTKEILPDVIHHHNISLLGAKTLSLRGTHHTLYTAHDLWLLCPLSTMEWCKTPRNCLMCMLRHRRPPQLWRYTLSLRRLLEDVSIIAPSRYYKDVLEAYGYSTLHIPNFTPPLPKREDWEHYVIYSGVLEPHKGISELVSFFEHNRSKHGWSLIVTGSGTLEHIVSHAKNVRYHGFVDRDTLLELQSKAGFTVMLSRWEENAPMSLLESLSLGVPLIVSDKGGLPELVEGGAGFVIKDAHELNRLEELSDAEITKMRRDAYHVWENRYSPEAYYKRYMELLDNASNHL
ncbi:MAG: glycosyltransferase [Methermicoccaceae archaeon]